MKYIHTYISIYQYISINRDVAWPIGDVYNGATSVVLSCFGEMVGCVCGAIGVSDALGMALFHLSHGGPHQLWCGDANHMGVNFVEIRDNLNAQRHVNEILPPPPLHVQPHKDNYCAANRTVLMQHWASPHTAAYLNNSCVKRLLMSCLGQARARTWT